MFFPTPTFFGTGLAFPFANLRLVEHVAAIHLLDIFFGVFSLSLAGTRYLSSAVLAAYQVVVCRLRHGRLDPMAL